MLTIDYSEYTNKPNGLITAGATRRVKDPFEDSLLAQTILHNNRGKYRLRNYQDSIKASYDYKTENMLSKATRHNTRRVEVSKLKDEMADIKRGQSRLEENATNSELYQHKRVKTATPLIDPEPFKITTKTGTGKGANCSGADMYVAMVSRNL